MTPLVLGEDDVEALRRDVERAVLLKVVGLHAREREPAPAHVLAALRDPEGLGVVPDDLGLPGVADAGAGVEGAAGVVAVVADDVVARDVVGVFDHDDIGAVGLHALALSEAPLHEGARVLLDGQHAAGGVEDGLDAARAGGMLLEAVVGLRAVDGVDHLDFPVEGEPGRFRLGGDGRGAERGGGKEDGFHGGGNGGGEGAMGKRREGCADAGNCSMRRPGIQPTENLRSGLRGRLADRRKNPLAFVPRVCYPPPPSRAPNGRFRLRRPAVAR